MEQLKQDVARLSAELSLTNQEKETAQVDTYKATLKDKLNNLQQENKLLKEQIESKFDTETF